MSVNSKEKLLEILKEIVAGHLADIGSALCFNVVVKGGNLLLLDEYMGKWPKRSRVENYPVPHFNGPVSGYYGVVVEGEGVRDLNRPEDYYWNTETQYGRDRMELVEFVITTIKEELKNE